MTEPPGVAAAAGFVVFGCPGMWKMPRVSRLPASWWVLLSLVSVVGIGVAGCVLPGHEKYVMGAARIGDDYYIFAPLCADERITSITVYDNGAQAQDEDVSPESTAYDYWAVRDPVDSKVARGWFRIGDDSAFKTVIIPAGSNIRFPEVVAVSIEGTSGDNGFGVDDVFRADEVPAYPDGTDPRSIKYEYGAAETRDLTPEEISEISKCASEYTY